MKIPAIFFILCVAATCQTIPAAGTHHAEPTSNIAEANSQKAKKIIQQCIQALGGEKFLSVVDSEQRGRGYGFYQNTPQGIGTVYVRMYKYPDKERYEFTKKRDWIIIHNGDKGYDITFRGSAQEDAKDLKAYQRRRHYALDYVLRDWTKEKGTAFFFDGDTIVGPKDVHKITLMDAENQGVTLYIDTITGLPIKKSFTWRDPDSREMEQEEELFDEYRMEQGVNTPHVITRMNNGEVASQRFIYSVKYNSGTSDSLFEVPVLHYDRTKK